MKMAVEECEKHVEGYLEWCLLNLNWPKKNNNRAKGWTKITRRRKIERSWGYWSRWSIVLYSDQFFLQQIPIVSNQLLKKKIYEDLKTTFTSDYWTISLHPKDNDQYSNCLNI
jgi:hypothetical protein